MYIQELIFSRVFPFYVDRFCVLTSVLLITVEYSEDVKRVNCRELEASQIQIGHDESISKTSSCAKTLHLDYLNIHLVSFEFCVCVDNISLNDPIIPNSNPSLTAMCQLSLT